MKHRPENSILTIDPTAENAGRHRSTSTRAPRRMLPVLLAVLLLGAAGAVSVLVLPRTAADSASTAEVPALVAADSPTADSGVTARSTAAPSSAIAAPVAATTVTTTQDAAPLATCGLPGGVLTVAAAPAIAPVVQRYWDSAAGEFACPLSLTAIEPADAIAAWTADPAAVPDVWIPDSSVWPARAAQAGLSHSASSGSLATSPTVVALSATAAQRIAPGDRPTLSQVLASRSTAVPVRVALPDPSRTMTSALALIDVEATVAGAPDANAALSWAMRSTPANAGAALTQLDTDPDTAIPTSEQAVIDHNRTATTPAVAVYAASTSALDFPFVITDPAATAIADGLRKGLQSAAGRELFAAAGFRDANGVLEATEPGVDTTTAIGAVPTRDRVDAVLNDLAVSNEPARLLAVLDVSGSMVAKVPGAGGATRLDLARAAAIRGLSLYSADSEIGVWSFSRHLDGDVDHRELVPVGRLADVVDGTTGRDRINAAFGAVQVRPDGDTGLYDTTLAAVRAMQASWEPGRVNSVLLLTDGKNDDPGSISLDDLVSTLRHEQDPTRPVPVIAIAFGPDSDVQALQQITAATTGSTYVAVDPRQIGEIFLDAVGQRICRPNC